MKKFILLMMVLSVVACTHTGTVSTVSPTNIYSGHDSKVAGKATYAIDSTSLTKLRKDDAVKGLLCGAHKYPVDGTDAFVASVPAMLDAVFEDSTEQANDPRKNTLNFVFRIERFDPRLKFTPKFFASDGEATVDLSVSAVGTYNGKRVFGTTVDSQRSASAEAGPFCSGGEGGLHEATAAVIKDVLEKIGERISNSSQIRDLVAVPQSTKKK
jgi:hypothetical protein